MAKRKTAADLHAEWMKKPSYAKAYAALEPEFQMASAIIEARKRARLTQAQLAERMGTTQTVVARLESGSGMPSTRTLERVADATGLIMTVVFAEKASTRPMAAASALPPKPAAEKKLHARLLPRKRAAPVRRPRA